MLLSYHFSPQSAQVELEKELRKGHVQIDEWLKKNKLPRMSLPVICGYIPLVSYLAKGLQSRTSSSSNPTAATGSAATLA